MGVLSVTFRLCLGMHQKRAASGALCWLPTLTNCCYLPGFNCCRSNFVQIGDLKTYFGNSSMTDSIHEPTVAQASQLFL